MIKNKKQQKGLAISALIISLLAFLFWVFNTGSFPFLKNWLQSPPAIKQFNGVYEPSAAVQLNNGDVLVLEDEISRALNLLTLDSAGSLRESAVRDKQLNAQLDERLDDLEGIALGPSGTVYATTSFSRTKKGKRRVNREKLLRAVFSDDGGLLRRDIYTDFAKALKDSEVFDVLGVLRGKKLTLKEINIEGLGFDASKQHLLFGFKKPLINDLSLIIGLENPQQIFDEGESPIFLKEPILLDLHGGGIRSLTYVDKLKGYLIVNEVSFGGGPKQSQLWFWAGGKQQPVSLIIPEVTMMQNIEAIAPVNVAGEQSILLMSDDGSRRQKRPAHYLSISYEAIQQQLEP